MKSWGKLRPEQLSSVSNGLNCALDYPNKLIFRLHELVKVAMYKLNLAWTRVAMDFVS